MIHNKIVLRGTSWHQIIALAFGCGSDNNSDGSGVDATLPLGTLAVADVDAVCSYAASLSRTVDCDGEAISRRASRTGHLMDLFGVQPRD